MQIAPVAAMGRYDPLTSREFEAAMAAVAPFEMSPHLAVALSGGADSVALCVMADVWARTRGGRVTALTVDHGLRPASAAEAGTVGGWMAALGIDHRVLRWDGRKPATGVQAAAREARYRLLSGWCRETGVLHLLLGHHRRDQAETVLIRLQRGSGVHGLAAMAALSETPAVRLLRPLLDVPPERLRAVLAAHGQDWIEDPSNRDPAYLRSRLRAALPSLAAAGITEDALAAVATRMGRTRASLEHAASVLLARCFRAHPAGYGRIDDPVMAAAPAEVSLRALARVVLCIGGRRHEPGVEKLERLHARLIVERAATSQTLGGCRLLRTDRGLLVCRELRGLPAPTAVACGVLPTWDGRFAIGFAATGGVVTEEIRLVPLGATGWNEVVDARPEFRRHPVPPPARLSLPALADDEGILNVPHLGYRRAGSDARGIEFAVAAFRPTTAASGAGHFLA